MRLSALIFVVACGGLARATDTPTCRTFDRTPACCPHPPPHCCPAALDGPLDDAAVTQICGAAPVKGQAEQAGMCKRYFERGGDVAEIGFGRQPGDVAALDKLRASLAVGRARVESLAIAGAQKAFIVRELDDGGKPMRISWWALAGGEIVHVDAETTMCAEAQTRRLLTHALERLHPSAAAPTTARRAP